MTTMTAIEPTGAQSPLTTEQARTLTDQIRSAVTDLYNLVVQAYKNLVWLPLGYDTWDEYLSAEFADVRMPKLPAAERRDTIRMMRTAGMSLRAIEATGVASKPTIIKDTQGVDRPAVITDRAGDYRPTENHQKPPSGKNLTTPVVEVAPKPAETGKPGRAEEHDIDRLTLQLASDLAAITGFLAYVAVISGHLDAWPGQVNTGFRGRCLWAQYWWTPDEGDANEDGRAGERRLPREVTEPYLKRRLGAIQKALRRDKEDRREYTAVVVWRDPEDPGGHQPWIYRF